MKQAVLSILITALTLPMLAHAADSRIMTDAEYKIFLNEVSSKLPEWKVAFKTIDPAKSDVSYDLGEKIVRYRDLGLKQTNWVHEFVEKQQLKRTVSGELALREFLQ